MMVLFPFFLVQLCARTQNAIVADGVVPFWLYEATVFISLVRSGEVVVDERTQAASCSLSSFPFFLLSCHEESR